MKPLAAIIAFCLGCLAAVAMGQPTAEMTQAIVRIHNGSSAGSGCLVGKDERSGLIVTCNHLFTEGVFQPVVIFPNGERFQANVVAQDRVEDLAALEIATPTAAPVPLANYRPEKGTRLFSAGYGSTVENALAVNAGDVTHYADRGQGKYATVKITGSVRNGDSGGPIFNEQGELAAVIWGGSQEGVYGTGSHEVNVLLAQCQNGVCQPYRIQPPRYQPQVRPAQPTNPAPLQPVPPKQNPPVVVAPPVKGCECTGEGACKCDPAKQCQCGDLSKLACKCDGKDVAELNAYIKKLEIRIGELEKHPACKSCECKSQDDAATRPGQPVYFDIKPRKR